MKLIGYIVMESADHYEQGLQVLTGFNLPAGGILAWGHPVAVFPTRADAHAAIKRTEHYRLAFSDQSMPEKQFCKVVRLVAAPEQTCKEHGL